MDFIVGLPCTSKGYNSIWVIVDRLTKSAHFLLVNSTYSARKYAELYLDQIVTVNTEFSSLTEDTRSKPEGSARWSGRPA